MPEEELDPEDVLRALCIDAQANPETFNAESLRSALEAADLLSFWNEAEAKVGEDGDDEDEEDEDEEDEDEDEEP